MAATLSTMLKIGTKAPEFNLPDINDHMVSLNNLKFSKGILVMFICNHCPYVKHLNDALVEFALDYKSKGIQCVAISSNDVQSYPQDSPELMKELSEQYNFPFPYLYDESQEVAKAYKAACTPDFFLFNQDLKLFYRGQFDNSRPGNGKPVTGSDLRKAANDMINNKKEPEHQVPSMGCNIKWKQGNEPDYFNYGN